MVENIAYYVPKIPDVWSTDRYQHALGLMSAADRGIILTNESVPGEISRIASEVRIVEGSRLEGAKQAARIADKHLSTDDTFVTSYHYEPALSGLISKRAGIRWVADIYETPAQYRLNAPYSHHQVTSRILERVLGRSDRSIHSFHYETPYQYGRDRQFITNGAPTSKITPSYEGSDSIRVVWAGSPRMDRGGEYLVQALSELSAPYQVDVYGSTEDEIKDFVEQYGISSSISFHGWTEHNEVLSAIRNATIGYAVLPPRTDWKYAPAIKIGEYLAGGTIPLVSAFPGSRYIAGEAGYYVTPSAKSVRIALSKITEKSVSERQDLMQKARRRANVIAWEKIRKRFVEIVIRK